MKDETKAKYSAHKRGAKARGIEFTLSYEQWLAIWGDDLHKRGVHVGQLGMLRTRDEGGYTPDNVRLGTPLENQQEKVVAYRVKKAQAPVKSPDFRVTAPARGAWLWRCNVFDEYIEEEEYA